MQGIPASWFLILASAIFCIGIYGVLVRKNFIAVLMSIELILNASNINLITFWRYNYSPTSEDNLAGIFFALFVISISAAEVAVGLGIIISCYKKVHSMQLDDYNQLHG